MAASHGEECKRPCRGALLVPFARGPGGRLFAPHEAAAATGSMLCAACAKAVHLVRATPARAQHWRHAVDSGCNAGGESLLHAQTKEWIALHLPGLRLHRRCRVCDADAGVLCLAEPGRTEVAVAGADAARFVADVAAGSPVHTVLEVLVTHPCSGAPSPPPPSASCSSTQRHSPWAPTWPCSATSASAPPARSPRTSSAAARSPTP